jgi:hypothetical protein
MIRLGLVLALLACACSKTNPNYCANAPQHNCSNDAPGIDSPKGCQSAADCAGTADPVCDLLKHQCVQCNASDTSECTGMTPVCDVMGETCRKCQTHADCGTSTMPGACLPDGSCGTDSNVAWISPDGTDAATCTRAAPCVTITHALAQAKPFIKVSMGSTSTISDNATIGQNVTILADPGAKLTSAGMPAITVTGTSTVAIHDLRILGSPIGVTVAAGNNPTLSLEHVILDGNSQQGINVAGGTLTMSRCMVSANTQGGAVVAATFDITNSVFVANGSATSPTGGLTLTPSSASSVFRFNTVSDNASSAVSVGSRGVNCVVPMAMTSDIITGNQSSTNCSFDYSLFDTGTATAHNKIGAPGFRNTNPGDPSAADYYRIGSTSPAVDSADPAATLAVDIDDHPRPQGATYDIGASEYMP